MAKKQILDLAGLSELTAEIKQYISEYVSDQKVLPFASTSEFPGVGKSDAIYIDRTHGTIYRWDDEDTKYYYLAFNPDDIYIMDCGSARSKEGE